MKDKELNNLKEKINSLFPNPTQAEVEYAIRELRKLKGKVEVVYVQSAKV